MMRAVHFIWCVLCALCLVCPALVQADDDLPENIDLSRSSVQYTLRLANTGLERLFVAVDIDSDIKRAGVLGKGVCLNLLIQSRRGARGRAIDLESTLALEGKVLARNSCQGRRDLRDFKVDVTSRQRFMPNKGYEWFADKPTLKPESKDVGRDIGNIYYSRPFDGVGNSYLSVDPDGIEVMDAVNAHYDASGVLRSLNPQLRVSSEKFPDDVAEAARQAHMPRADELADLSEISLDRDAQGRITKIWLQRFWGFLGEDNRRVMVAGTKERVTYKAQPEFVAEIQWRGAKPVAIQNALGEVLAIGHSADGREVKFTQQGAPLAEIRFNAAGLIESMRDDLGEHSLFYAKGGDRLVAYISPKSCLYVFGKAGAPEGSAFKVDLRQTCPAQAAVRWEGNYTIGARTGEVNGSARVTDAKGSRTVSNDAR